MVLFYCFFAEFYVQAYIAPKKWKDAAKANLDQLSSEQVSNKAKEKTN
jgi:hypothetical protein